MKFGFAVTSRSFGNRVSDRCRRPSAYYTRSRRSTSARACRRPCDSSPGGGRPREIPRARRAAAPARCPRRLRGTRRCRPSPASRRRCRSSRRRASPRPRHARATATERISASSAARRDTMKPTKRAPAGGAVRDHVAVGQQLLELVLAPAATERGAHAAPRARRRRAAARRQRRLGAREQPGEPAIIGAAAGRRPAAARRARADRAASAAAPSSCAAAPRRATQPMSGAACSSTRGVGDPLGQCAATSVAPRADDHGRPDRHGAHRRAHAIEPRRHERRPVRREHLEIDLLVARIDRRHDGRGRRAPRHGARRAPTSVDRPTAGLPAASAMPRAAEMPTRSPVKLPGPTVTAMRSSSAKSQRAASITRAISGITASAWPRTIASDSLARIAPARVSSTAAEQARARYRWQERA